MSFPKHVRLTEIGPRDGLQNESRFLPTETKIEVIRQLAKAGFSEIEVTSFVHPKWIPNLADAEEVVRGIGRLGATTYALVPNRKGYERALACGIDGITFVVSSTDTHNQKNLNRSTIESIAEIRPLVNQAKSDGRHVRASVSTVFGCPFEGKPSTERIFRVIDQLAESGFGRIGLCDTIGVADPAQVLDLVSQVRRRFSQLEFELHFHNTYGRGLANILAGLTAGVTAFDSCIGGLGGCPYAPGATGNISTEDLVAMLHAMGIETGINQDEMLVASDLLTAALEKPLESQIWRVKQSGCALYTG